MAAPNPRKMSRTASLALGLGLGGALLLGGGYALAYAMAGDNVPRNAVVAGVPIGGLAPAQAEQKLRSELATRAGADITLTAGKTTLSTTPGKVGLGVDYAASVARAGGGRSWNPATLLTVLFGGSSQSAVLTVDDAALTATVAALAHEADVAPVDAGISYSEGKPVRSAGRQGLVVDTAATARALTEAYLTSTEVAAVVTTREPEVTTAEADLILAKIAEPAVSDPVKVRVGDAGSFLLDQDAIAATLGFTADNGTLKPAFDTKALGKKVEGELKALGLKQAKDATITIANGRPKIMPSRDGRGVDAEALAAAVTPVLGKSSGRTATVDVVTRKASFTTAEAKALKVKEVTGSFTTYFPGSAYRYNNIGKAARLIHGTFLKPGETFSMNQTLGKRTREAGWMAGGAIDGGKIVERLGGGISQATTTTFNAIFFAGLKDIYHKPHSLYFSRYPVGREATLDWVSVDMKFQNDSPYGVVLQAWITGRTGSQGTITVRVWSTKRYTIKSSTPVRSNYRSPGATSYDSSAGCTPQSAMTGFDVRFNRLFYQGKKLVRSEPFFWRYNSLTPVVCGKKP